MADLIEKYIVESEFVTVSLMVWRRWHKPMTGMIEKIYAANRDLADLGHFLPIGTVVYLPIPAEPDNYEYLEPVRLW